MGKPCQEFYGHQVADFGGRSPIAMLVSAGSGARPADYGNTAQVLVLISSHQLHALQRCGNGWTEANSQDAMDKIEKVVDETIAANLVNGTVWADLGYDGKTTTGIVQILGGDTYRYEIIPVRAQVWHD